MGIFEGVYGQLALILTCLGAGVVGSAMHSLGLWRSCRSLRLRVVDLENAHLQLRNKGYAQKRWNNQEQLEAELAAMTKDAKPASRQKYDNDPLEY